MLSSIYRRWAALRLRTIFPWVETWALEEIYAGAMPQGATDATYTIGLAMEQMRLKGEAYSGAAVDISKFFDQVIRSLLYELARQAGMPENIIGAYDKVIGK